MTAAVELAGGRTMTWAVTSLEPGKSAVEGTQAAGIRVVLEGEVRFTPSSGPELTLVPGDVARTRDAGAERWQAGDSGAVWFDATDLEPERAPCPRLRHRGACPPGERLACPSRPRVHRWARTEDVLASAAADGSFPQIARFGVPRPGGDLTPTLRAEVHRLDAGRRTPSVWASRSSVVAVLAGSGTSVVHGRRLCWDARDVFVVPAGAPVDHHADVTSDLFIVSDAPALEVG